MDTQTLSRRELLGAVAGAGAVAVASRVVAQGVSGSGDAARAAAPANAPHFGFTKLIVGDLEKAAAFYQATCGLVEQRRIDTESAGRKLTEILYQPTAPGGATFVLIHFYDTPEPAHGELILGFNTSDIDAFVARAAAAGGAIQQAPYSIEELKIKVAFVRDVEGHLIEVVQPTP